MGNLCAKDDTDQTATSPLSGQKKGGTPAPGKATTGRATKFSYQLIPPTQPKYEASRDPADYACEKLPPGTPWVRLPGQINDQRINIETARGSVFVLLDQCDSVQIDDAQDCSFYIGPTTGAVFIRDCKNCKFVVLCGQLRLRDTHNSSFALYCRSRPVIESSTKVSIGCFSAPQYIELRSQMAKAGLSIWNNLWYHVHDFTPKSGNWSPLSPEAARDVLPTIAAFSKGEVSEEEERISRVVPYVCGPSNVDPRLATTTFVSKPGATDEVENFFLAEVSEGSRWKLVETGEVKLSDDNCAALTAMSGVSVFSANHVVVVIVAVVRAESAATLKDLAWVAHYEQGARGQQLRDCLIGGAGADSGFGQAL